MPKIVSKSENFGTGKEIFAVLAVDENGEQGIVGSPLPLVCLRDDIIEHVLKEVKELEEYTDKEIRIVKFTNPEILYSSKEIIN